MVRVLKDPKGDQGNQGPKGDQGVGFSLTSRGDYSMLGKQLKGMAEGTSFTDAVRKSQLDTKLSLSGGLMTGNLDMNSYRIYNVAQPDGDNQPATKVWLENKFLDKSSGVMAGPLNTSNNKITHLAKPTDDKDGVNKKYIDDNYLKLSGGTMTGHIILNNAILTSQYQAISRNTGNAFFVQITNPYVYHQFNMVKNKIINLGDPTDATDAVNKQYLEKSHVKPSHYNNEFKYLMTNRLAWADLEPNNIDSFDITKIDNLMPQDGNYHQYNHKVLYTTIIKDQQGGYSYKMGINCYQLDKDKDYTLCIEILNSDYQLWHKSVATIDKTTSKGVSVAGFTVEKFSHWYTNSSGNTAYMYYGIMVSGIQPNICFPRMDIANIWEGGLRIQNTTLSLELFSKRSFTLCVVMQLWLNRSLSIKTLMSNGAYEKPHLIYDKTTKKLKLRTNGLRAGTTNETSITLLDSFNGKRVVFWLTKEGTGGDLTVKASVSNYSGTLTLSSALASQSNYTFRIFSEDTVIYRVMYSPNFYDFDSSELYTILLQEKLNSSYIP